MRPPSRREPAREHNRRKTACPDARPWLHDKCANTEPRGGNRRRFHIAQPTAPAPPRLGRQAPPTSSGAGRANSTRETGPVSEAPVVWPANCGADYCPTSAECLPELASPPSLAPLRSLSPWHRARKASAARARPEIGRGRVGKECRTG